MLILQVSRTLEQFDVEERHMSTVEAECANVKVIQKTVKSLDTGKHVSHNLNWHSCGLMNGIFAYKHPLPQISFLCKTHTSKSLM